MSQIYKNSSGGGTVPTQFTTDNGIAVPAANNLNVFGGTGTTTSGSGSTITITVKTEGFAWSDKAITFDANIENGYFCTAALTVNLPPNVSFPTPLVTGATVIIYVDTSSAVIIQAAAGQTIEISQNQSSVAGTATSTAQGNIVTLVYRTSDTTWHAVSSAGSFVMA